VPITQSRAKLVLSLFDQYYTRVFCFARKSLQAEQAEDIAQEVFSRMLQLEHLEEIEISVSYLIKTADNLIKRRWNRGQRFQRYVDTVKAGVRPVRRHVNTEHVCPDVRSDLATRLDRLTDTERDTVRMVICQGMSYQEAAAAMGVPVSTINNWKYRGLQKLKEDALDSTVDIEADVAEHLWN